MVRRTGCLRITFTLAVEGLPTGLIIHMLIRVYFVAVAFFKLFIIIHLFIFSRHFTLGHGCGGYTGCARITSHKAKVHMAAMLIHRLLIHPHFLEIWAYGDLNKFNIIIIIIIISHYL